MIGRGIALLCALISALCFSPCDAQTYIRPGQPQLRPGIVAGTFTYDTSAQVLFAAMTTPPNSTRKGVINNLIVCKKAAGSWGQDDKFYVFAAADQQAALLDWKDPTTTAVTNLAPTFTADRGFTSDGSTSYLSQTYNPATFTGRTWTTNSTHMMAWLVTNATGTYLGQTAAGGAYLSGNVASGTLGARLNETTSFAFSGGPIGANGYYLVNRSASGTTGGSVQGYINGTTLTTSAGAVSASVVGGGVNILRGNTTPAYSTATVGAASIGGSYSGAVVAADQACLSAYMTAVGAQ